MEQWPGRSRASWPYSAMPALRHSKRQGASTTMPGQRKNLPSMGLTAKPTSLRMAWHRDGDGLVKEQSLDTPGVGRVDYRENSSDATDPLFSAIRRTDETSSPPANGMCATRALSLHAMAFAPERTALTPQEFVERHVATVQRGLRVVGHASHRGRPKPPTGISPRHGGVAGSGRPLHAGHRCGCLGR